MREDELDRLAINIVNAVLVAYDGSFSRSTDSGLSKYISAARTVLKEEGIDDLILVSEQILTVLALRTTLAIMKSWGAIGNMGLALTYDDLASSPYKKECVKVAYKVLRKALEEKDMLNEVLGINW